MKRVIKLNEFFSVIDNKLNEIRHAFSCLKELTKSSNKLGKNKVLLLFKKVITDLYNWLGQASSDVFTAADV